MFGLYTMRAGDLVLTTRLGRAVATLDEKVERARVERNKPVNDRDGLGHSGKVEPAIEPKIVSKSGLEVPTLADCYGLVIGRARNVVDHSVSIQNNETPGYFSKRLTVDALAAALKLLDAAKADRGGRQG